MGAELCLAHDMGGVEAYGGPLSVDMQPYGCFHFKIWQISCGFHADFTKSSRCHADFMKSGGFHVDFMKSGRFHVDFMKSSRFHKIWQISCRFHEIHLKTFINKITQQKLFSFMECSGKAMSQDFTKSAGFRKTNCQEW